MSSLPFKTTNPQRNPELRGNPAASRLLFRRKVRRPDFQLPIYLWDVLERDPDSEDILPLLDNGKEPRIRTEYPVDAETPPAFLAQSKDDFCQIETTVFYFRALQAAGVKNCRMELRGFGGHGYGLRTVGKPTDDWSEKAAEWLKGLK